MKKIFASCGSRQGAFRRLAPAFSLVEVVLALGVASFAVLTIIALLPVGIQSSKDSLDETNAINVLSAVIADRQATPFASASTVYQLPLLSPDMSTATGIFGVAENDQRAEALAQARYRVDYRITPPGPRRLDSYQVWLRVSWPPTALTPDGLVETLVTFAQP